MLGRETATDRCGASFGNDMGPAEGPLWRHEDGYLLFSDIGNNRRMRWTPGKGVTVVQERTNRANGLTRDRRAAGEPRRHEGR